MCPEQPGHEPRGHHRAPAEWAVHGKMSTSRRRSAISSGPSRNRAPPHTPERAERRRECARPRFRGPRSSLRDPAADRPPHGLPRRIRALRQSSPPSAGTVNRPEQPRHVAKTPRDRPRINTKGYTHRAESTPFHHVDLLKSQTSSSLRAPRSRSGFRAGTSRHSEVTRRSPALNRTSAGEKLHNRRWARPDDAVLQCHSHQHALR